MRLSGLWLKKPGCYTAETDGSITLVALMEQSGGFMPFDKNSRFPSCVYVVRSIDDALDGRAPKHFFDGRRHVRADGSIDPAGLPDIRVNAGETVWFDWTLL